MVVLMLLLATASTAVRTEIELLILKLIRIIRNRMQFAGHSFLSFCMASHRRELIVIIITSVPRWPFDWPRVHVGQHGWARVEH